MNEIEVGPRRSEADTYSPPASPTCSEQFESDQMEDDYERTAAHDTYVPPPLPNAVDDQRTELDSYNHPPLLVEYEPLNDTQRQLDSDEAEQILRRASSVVVSEDTEIKRFVRSQSPERAAGEPVQDFEARKENAGSTPKERRKSYQTCDEGSGSDESLNGYEHLAGHNLRKIKPMDDLSKEAYEPTDKGLATTDTYRQPQLPAYIDLAHQQNSRDRSSTESSKVTSEELHMSVVPSTRNIVVHHGDIQEIMLETVNNLEGSKSYEQQLLPPRRVHSRHVEPSEVKTYEPVIRHAVERVVGENDAKRMGQSSEVKRPKEGLAEGQGERRSLLLGEEFTTSNDLQSLVEEVRKIDSVYHRPLARLSVKAHDRLKAPTFEKSLVSPEEQPTGTGNRVNANVYTSTTSTEEVNEMPVKSVTTARDIAIGNVYESDIMHDQDTASEYDSASSTEYIYVEPSAPGVRTPSAKMDVEKNISGSDVEQTRLVATSASSVADTYEAPTVPDIRRPSARSHPSRQVSEPVVQPIQTRKPAQTGDTYRKPPTPIPQTSNAENRASGITSNPDVEQVLPIDASTNDTYEKPSTPITRTSSIKDRAGRIVSEATAGAIREVIPVYASTSVTKDTYKKPSAPIAGTPARDRADRNISGSSVENSRDTTMVYTSESSTEDVYEEPSVPSSLPLHDSSSHPEENDRSETPQQQSGAHEPVYYRPSGPDEPDTYKRPTTPVLSDTTRSGTVSPLSANDESVVLRRDPHARKSETPPVHYRRSRQSGRLRNAPNDQRRSRSVIEPAVSDSVRRVRRANSSDSVLGKEMEAFVRQHRCDPICYKLVCPKRLAESPYDKHDAKFYTLTNLDILRRRRLSYLLAIEAQRFLVDQGSRYISATAEMLWDNGHRSPDSGCDPSSKTSEGGSDAALADDDNSSIDEETINCELAKIEQRRLSFHPELALRPILIPPPSEYSEREAQDRSGTYTEPELPIYENIRDTAVDLEFRAGRRTAYSPAKKMTTVHTVDDAEAESSLYENIPAFRNETDADKVKRSAPLLHSSRKNAEGRDLHGESVTTTSVVAGTSSAAHRKPSEPKRNKSKVTEFAVQQMLGDSHDSSSEDRESVKARFEGQIVFEASPRNSMRSPSREAQPALTAPVPDVMQQAALFALEAWKTIWTGVPPAEVPQLSNDQIISLHDPIQHFIANLTSLQHVREELRNVISKVFDNQSTRPVSAQQKLDPRDNQNNWQGQMVRDQRSFARAPLSEVSELRQPMQQAPNEERLIERF